jgi:hypothetical protein
LARHKLNVVNRILRRKSEIKIRVNKKKSFAKVCSRINGVKNLTLRRKISKAIPVTGRGGP